jgi:hypothetical protein
MMLQRVWKSILWSDGWVKTLEREVEKIHLEQHSQRGGRT